MLSDIDVCSRQQTKYREKRPCRKKTHFLSLYFSGRRRRTLFSSIAVGSFRPSLLNGFQKIGHAVKKKKKKTSSSPFEKIYIFRESGIFSKKTRWLPNIYSARPRYKRTSAIRRRSITNEPKESEENMNKSTAFQPLWLSFEDRKKNQFSYFCLYCSMKELQSVVKTYSFFHII